jgi:hypothetical protein
MNDPLINADDDASTPLTPDERQGLIPTYITLRSELNEAEQIGIEDADRWAFRRKRNILDENALFQLHKRMFANVWKWAGEPRESPRSIGSSTRPMARTRSLSAFTSAWCSFTPFRMAMAGGRVSLRTFWPSSLVASDSVGAAAILSPSMSCADVMSMPSARPMETISNRCWVLRGPRPTLA